MSDGGLVHVRGPKMNHDVAGQVDRPLVRHRELVHRFDISAARVDPILPQHAVGQKPESGVMEMAQRVEIIRIDGGRHGDTPQGAADMLRPWGGVGGPGDRLQLPEHLIRPRRRPHRRGVNFDIHPAAVSVEDVASRGKYPESVSDAGPAHVFSPEAHTDLA